MKTVGELDKHPELVTAVQSGKLGPEQEYAMVLNFVKKDGRTLAATSLMTNEYPTTVALRKRYMKVSIVYKGLALAAIILVILAAIGLIRGNVGMKQLYYLIIGVVLGAACLPFLNRLNKYTTENMIYMIKEHTALFDVDKLIKEYREQGLEKFADRPSKIWKIIPSADGKQRAVIFEDATIEYEELTFYTRAELENVPESEGGKEHVGKWITRKGWSEWAESTEDAEKKAVEWLAI